MFQRRKLKAIRNATAQTSTVYERQDIGAIIEFSYAKELGMPLLDQERALAAGPAWCWLGENDGHCEGTVLVTDLRTMMYWLDPLVNLYLNNALAHDHVDAVETNADRPETVLLWWRDPDWRMGLTPRMGKDPDECRRAREWQLTLPIYINAATADRFDDQ